MAAPSSIPLFSVPLSFRNQAGELCIGTLECLDSIKQFILDAISFGELDGTSECSPPLRCAVLCHGMLSNRNDYFIPQLSHDLLNSCESLDCVFRFDWSGMGESEGTFQYGGYQKLVQELSLFISTLRSKHNISVSHIIGHSMGAQTVMLYAAKFANVPHVIAIGQCHSQIILNCLFLRYCGRLTIFCFCDSVRVLLLCCCCC